VAGALLPLVLLASCATNPVTGRPEIVLMSESQEIAMGKEAAPEIAAAMGIYKDDELQRYVESIGMRMASSSERPQLPWQFRVIDDSAVNAFAVPGGFVYITRGILAYMDNEAELASVVGHEIGHVTARHSVQQMTRQQFANIGLGIGMIGLAVIGAGQLGEMLGSVVGSGMQLLFLKYSRDDETQADDLGFRYMSAAGYAPEEMPKVFHTLYRTTTAEGGARVPEWASTHPAPENREGRIQEKIAKLAADRPRGHIERDAYLAKIDGIVYGADPRAGYFDHANVFHHPDLGVRVSFPAGWKGVNQPTAVMAVSPDQDAAVRLTLAKEKTAAAAARAFLSQEGIQSGATSAGSLNGLSAVSAGFGAATQQGGIQGRVAFVEHGGHVYQLLGLAPQQRFSSYSKILGSSIASFARETDPEVLAVKPWRVDVVKPARSLSIQEFADAYPGPVSPDELAIVNGVEAPGRYEAGTPYKRVVGQKLP
jgi:predicted Zn-dependent protease